MDDREKQATKCAAHNLRLVTGPSDQYVSLELVMDSCVFMLRSAGLKSLADALEEEPTIEKAKMILQAVTSHLKEPIASAPSDGVRSHLEPTFDLEAVRKRAQQAGENNDA